MQLEARVITSDEYVAHLDRLAEEEKEKEDQKKERKEEQQKKTGEKRARQEEAPTMENVGHCAICRSLTPPGSDADIDEWVQCELCGMWFHLACLNVGDVPDREWLCHKCSARDTTGRKRKRAIN